MLGDSSDKKSEPGARILCLAGWRGVFAGLVLAGIPTCLAAFTNLPARRVALPIEVLGDDGTTVSCTVALKVEEALSAHSLWLRTNGLRYPNQGSIQINEGPWGLLCCRCGQADLPAMRCRCRRQVQMLWMRKAMEA